MTKLQELLFNADNAYMVGEYDKAIEIYKQALVLRPKNRRARLWLRKAEEIKKPTEDADNVYYATEYDEAIELYKRVLDSDPENKYAQQQIRKAEINRISKSVKPKDLPTEALQFYKRSRSFITAGNLPLARKLLQQAVDVAKASGLDFPNAQDLLGNIKNALKAEEFKKRAFEELDTQQWAKAENDLSSAINLDPTDETIQSLLEHLRSLMKAHHLINKLKAGGEQIKNRSEAIKEIKEIIDLTNETTALSKLWQEVVKLLGEYNHKGIPVREIVIIILCTAVILLSMLWLFYLFPRNRVVVDCDSVSPDLQAEVNYPFYIANGDDDIIKITFTNVGDTVINGLVVFVFDGTANAQLVAPTNKSRIEFADFRPHEKKPVTINFSVDEPFSVISNPREYIDFSVCTSKDDYNTFHIAMSPIYGLHKLMAFLWSTIGLAFIGLFWSQIKDWLLSVFKGGNG